MQPIRRRRPAASDRDWHLDRDATAFHEALSDLLRVYQFRDRMSIGCHGISVTQCYALEALVGRGALTMNELAALLWLDKSTASRVVNGLEAETLVRRTPHPTDGRSILLEATPAGRRLHQRIVSDLIANEKVLLQELAPEVRQATTGLITRLAKAATARARAQKEYAPAHPD